MKRAIPVLALLTIVSLIPCQSFGSAATVDPARIIALGELKPGLYGASGHVAVTMPRAFYTKTIGEQEAPGACTFVILHVELTNLDQNPASVKDAITLRLEDGPQTVEGWDMDHAASRLIRGYEELWEREIAPRETARAFAGMVIGSFRVKENAQKPAAEARSRGFSAFVELAPRPRGMYVVAVRQSADLGEALFFVDIARQRGYTDAFVLPPPRPAPGR
ncbi:MAG: SPOR domain-containing protein [Bacillota bacterium]|nr:SPOR domain-containing protein [Bacillota bacterium]